MSQKITPNLWFNGVAKEAVEFYVSIFPDSNLGAIMYYPKSAEEGLEDFQKNLAGEVLTVDFVIGGTDFVGINAGPEFAPNPSTSFFVNFDPARMENAQAELDVLWEKLLDGGKALMPLQEYPFSKHYGWVEDKYGFSWQLMLTDPTGEPRPFIVPSLLFTEISGRRAEEALRYYVDTFGDSKIGNIVNYPKDHPQGATAGSLMFGDAKLAGQWLAAMDGVGEQGFTFTEAVSFSVACKDQEEIDYLWSRLSKKPENEQCGWCKDQFGVSWQIVPENMGELMKKPDAYKKMMQMKKINIEDF